MRKIFFFILLLTGLFCEGQVLQVENTYGREVKRLLVNTSFGFPKDTFAIPVNYRNDQWWASKNGSLYRWDTVSYIWRIFGSPSQACPANGVLNGSASVTWQGSGFNFSVAPGLYMIDCVPYTSDSGTVVLATADSDFDRFDVIYLATDGAIHILTGEPSASAAIPQVQGDEIALTAILVPAASTAFEPDEQIVYNHNTESTIIPTGTTTDGANITNTFTPTVSVNVTNINNGDVIFFTKFPVPSTWDITGIDIFSLHVKLKVVMPTLGTLRAQFYNGLTSAVSAEVAIPLDRNNITTYQAISIPMSAFGNIQTNQFTQVRFRYTSNNANNYTGFYLDYISFVDNIPTLPPTGAQVNLTLNSNGNAIVINPSNQIQNGGTWTLTGGGNSGQYVDGTLTVRPFPSLLTTIGDLDGRAKSSDGATIDLTTNSFHQQLANDLFPGLLSSTLFTKLNRNDSIQNIGTGDTLLVYANDSLLQIKSLIAGANITLTPSATGITIASTGGAGSTPTLQQVFNTEVGGSVLTKSDSIQAGAFQLKIYGSSVPFRVESTASTPAIFKTGANTNSVLRLQRDAVDSTSVSPFLFIEHQTTGTPLNGIGSSISFSSDLAPSTNLQEINLIISTASNATALTSESNLKFTGRKAGSVDTLMTMQHSGIILVNNQADTLATRDYARSVGGGGGSSFLPVTGTGTATGDVIGDLDGNTLTIEQSGFAWLTLDPTAGSEVASLRAWNTTGTGNQGILVLNATNTSAVATLTSDFDGASQLSRIELATDATTSTATYTAVQHTVAGLVRLNTLGGSGTRVVLTDNDGDLSGSGLGTGVATWWATPSSANLIAAITDETGTGLAVFGNTPTITTPVFSGAVSTTAINQLGTNASGTGYIPYVQSIIVRSDETLSNSSADQNLFTNTSHDVITVQANTTYEFYLTGDLTHGAVSHSIALGFTPTTATVTSIEYNAYAWVTAVGTATASQVSGRFKVTTTSVINLAGANAVETFEARGTITIGNTGGTITPQIKFSADPTGTILLKAGARMHIWPIGNDTFTVQGNIN